jgi:hypothetical protein
MASGCTISSALPEVIEYQGGRGDAEPGDPDGPFAEVPHVGVKRLGTGDGEEDRAEDDKGGVAVRRRKPQRMRWIERGEDAGCLHDVRDAGCAERHEPQQAHRPEQQAHDSGSVFLDREQRDQDPDRDRHDVGLERGGPDLQPLDRRQHADGRGEHRVAVEQRGAEHADGEQPASQARPIRNARVRERQQSHDAAFAPVVRAQDQRYILERHHDHQRPEDRRDAAQHVLGAQRNAVHRTERLLGGVQRAGADVAVDYAQREQCQACRCVLRPGLLARHDGRCDGCAVVHDPESSPAEADRVPRRPNLYALFIRLRGIMTS